jgi:hypothetical protein
MSPYLKARRFSDDILLHACNEERDNHVSRLHLLPSLCMIALRNSSRGSCTEADPNSLRLTT